MRRNFLFKNGVGQICKQKNYYTNFSNNKTILLMYSKNGDLKFVDKEAMGWSKFGL